MGTIFVTNDVEIRDVECQPTWSTSSRLKVGIPLTSQQDLDVQFVPRKASREYDLFLRQSLGTFKKIRSIHNSQSFCLSFLINDVLPELSLSSRLKGNMLEMVIREEK